MPDTFSEDSIKGDDADFDWCLAFGEGSRTMPVVDKDGDEPAPAEEKGVDLQLPNVAAQWPKGGYTTAPAGHELYTEKKVRDWGPSEWRMQGEWEALPWSERCGDIGARDTDTVSLRADDSFFRMMTQYMEKPWQCPVHTLKLAFMKSGLEVEERMNDTYDVLMLIVCADDELLEKEAQRLHKSGQVSCKRTFIRPPHQSHEQSFDDVNGPDMSAACAGAELYNPFRDEYMSASMYNYTTSGGRAGDGKDARWGLKMGTTAYDPELAHHFEDRRLNKYLFTTENEYDSSTANYKKFPHPRFFHSGERQELVKAIMENVEWARYLPGGMFEGSTPAYTAYPKVKLTDDAREETTCLLNTVAFGYPTEVTGSRRNTETVGGMKFLRSAEGPIHEVKHAGERLDVEIPTFKDIIRGTDDGEKEDGSICDVHSPWAREPTMKSWHDLDLEDAWRSSQEAGKLRTIAPRRMKIYPFMVDQCTKIADGQSHKIRDAEGDGMCNGEDQFYAVHLQIQNDDFNANVQDDDSYKLTHFKSEENDRFYNDIQGECPDKVREQQTFLVDCFPLHCPYERAYFRQEFASYSKLCTADVLSMPLDRIEGYFGSEAALYFAWLRCYTKALIIPGMLGLFLQLGVWADGGFPGSVNSLQGWLVAYCVFIALWSSLFMLDWKRRQAQLQHRWGLEEIEANQEPRKEFIEKLHAKAVLSGGMSCAETFAHCDHPIEKVTTMGKIEVQYASRCMHYSRQILTLVFILVGTFIVVFTSLGVLLMRARGQNVIAGSASAWTTLEYTDYDSRKTSGTVSDVSFEFWTVYDLSCTGLANCEERADEADLAANNELTYGFAQSRDLDDTQNKTQYLWRTSFEIIARQVTKIVDNKAILVMGDALAQVLLPACDEAQPDWVDTHKKKGLTRVCCTAVERADAQASTPCWTQGKQDLADAGTELTVTGIDPRYEERVSDDVHFWFIEQTLTNGESAIHKLPYAAIAARYIDEDPFANSVDTGYCERLTSSNFPTEAGSAAEIGHGCLFQSHLDLQRGSSAGLWDAYDFIDGVNPPAEIPRRVPLYEPSCGELEQLVVDTREELADINSDRNVKIETVSTPLYTIDGGATSVRNNTGAWVSYRRASPQVNRYIKTSLYLFRYPEGREDERCEVFDSDEIGAECSIKGYQTSAECVSVSVGGTWLPGISSNKATSDAASVSSTSRASAVSSRVSADTALYTRFPQASWGSSQVWLSTFLSVLAMQVYGRMWDTVATWLNNFENHRTQIEYEDSMIFKQFVFQFINYYFLLLYIAFLKVGAPFAPFMGASFASFDSTSDFNLNVDTQGRVVGVGGLEEIPVVELRDTCALDENDMPDCMSELCMQLITLFIFKTIALQMMETLLPKVSNHFAKNTPKPTTSRVQSMAGGSPEHHSEHTDWVYYQYCKPKFGNNSVGGSFVDFNEMVIQFGFMSLFAVGFPGAAFFALINNIQEMRSDANKIINQHQRPPVEQREDIGAWESVLQLVSYTAVVTNAVILGFTSQVIYKIFYEDGIEPISRRYTKYELWIGVAVTEHVIMLIKSMISSVAADEPAKLKAAKRDQAAAEADLKLEKESMKLLMPRGGQRDSSLVPEASGRGFRP